MKVQTNLILFLFIVLFPVLSYAQDWDSDSIQVKRLAWFYNQRAFPDSIIPEGAYSNAVIQRDNLTSGQGFFAPPHWSCLGPTPGGFSGYMVSGRIATVKFKPDDPMTIFVGGADGGVWKSNDGGQTWAPKTDFISSLSSGALAIGQNSSGQYINVYYGTGESHAGFNFCYYGDGFYKSADNGETWYQINDPNLPQRPTYFSRIVVRPGHPNELLAACGTNHTNISYQAGLYRSTDYGETWLPRVVPLPGNEGRVCNDVVYSPDPNSNMAYMIGPDENSQQIYEKGTHYRISTDGGASFGPPRDDVVPVVGRSHIAICRDYPQRIYIFTGQAELCGTNQYTYWERVYMSNDGGYSFVPLFRWLNVNTCNGLGGEGYQSWYDMFIYVSPSNPDVVYVGLVNLWKSTDGGQSFTNIIEYHPDFHNMDFDPNNSDHMIVGDDGGLFSIQNGVWTDLNQQLTFTQIYRIASSPFNSDVIVGGAQDNGVQSKWPGSNSWRDVLGGCDGTAMVYSKIDPNLIFGGYGNYIGSTPPYIIRSTNAGGSFQSNFLIPNQIWDSQNDWIPPIASYVDNNTGVETFLTARRVNTVGNNVAIRFFTTTNGGALWNQFSDIPSTNESPQNLAISESNPQVMFLSTGSYAWPSVQQKLYKSTNGGVNWSDLNVISNGVPNRYITHVEVDPASESYVYLTLSGFEANTPGSPGHIFASGNGGVNW